MIILQYKQSTLKYRSWPVWQGAWKSSYWHEKNETGTLDIDYSEVLVEAKGIKRRVNPELKDNLVLELGIEGVLNKSERSYDNIHSVKDNKLFKNFIEVWYYSSIISDWKAKAW